MLINLAATDTWPDRHVRNELERCRIRVVASLYARQHVPTRLSGVLGPLTFERAPIHWVVSGPLALSFVEALLEHPILKTDVDAVSNRDAPAPADHARYFDAEYRPIWPDRNGEQERNWSNISAAHPDWAGFRSSEKPIFAPDPRSIAAHAVVDTFHVTTELGLYLFAEAIRTALAERRIPDVPDERLVRGV